MITHTNFHHHPWKQYIFSLSLSLLGTYHKGVSPNGLILSDHMTLGAVVATILIIDNTAQVSDE